MAITLPPPLPPIEQSAEQIRALGEEQLRIDYGQTRLHLHGLRPPDLAQLQRDLQASDTAGDALLAIAYRCASDGWPAVRVSYAVTGPQDIEVGIVAARVQRVLAPASLQTYFADLPQLPVLRERALERDRALAEVQADRSGRAYDMQWLPVAGDTAAVVLQLAPSAQTVPQTSGALTVGNSGNRYGGPYLANLALQQAFANGTELGIGGSSAPAALGDRQRYDALSGSASQITTYGLFEIDLEQAHFHLNAEPPVHAGRLRRASLGWELPLYSDFATHLSLRLQLDQQGETLDADNGQTLLSEHYHVASLSLHETGQYTLADRTLSVDVSLALRKGLGPASTPLSNAELSFCALQPALELRYGLSENWSAYTSARLQVANAVLPQQEQLVLGGNEGLQAYQAGSAVGDRGQIYTVGAQWQAIAAEADHAFDLQLRWFYEYGSTHLGDARLLSNAGNAEASDLGVMAIATLTPQLLARLSLAAPLGAGLPAPPSGNDRRTLQFELRLAF